MCLESFFMFVTAFDIPAALLMARAVDFCDGTPESHAMHYVDKCARS